MGHITKVVTSTKLEKAIATVSDGEIYCLDVHAIDGLGGKRVAEDAENGDLLDYLRYDGLGTFDAETKPKIEAVIASTNDWKEIFAKA